MTLRLTKYTSIVFLFLFFFTCAPKGTKAQTNALIDSLKQELAKHSEHDSTRIKILAKLASKLRHSATTEALAYGHEAMFLSDSLQISEARSSTYQILGLIYLTRIDYRNALFYTLQALRIYEAENEVEGKAYAYNAIGIIYREMKKYDLGVKYLLLALQGLKSKGLDQRLWIIYNNLGNASVNDKRKSLVYYRLALDNFYTHKDTAASQIVGDVLLNIGETFYDLGELDSAQFYFKKALYEADYVIRDLHTIALSDLGMAKVALKRGEIRKARAHIMKAKKIVETGNIGNIQEDLYLRLIDMYKAEGNIDEMYKCMKAFDVMQDSIYSETTVKQMNEMQETYQVEKRDKEIQLLNQNQQIIEVNAKNQSLIRNSAIAVLLLTLIIGIVVSRNIVLTQRIRNRLLSEKNALAEKNIVKLNHENTLAKFEAIKSKTDPHFLFNNLTTLSSIVLEDPQLAVKYIKQFSHLFRMVLEIGDHKTVTLQKELEVINSYLYLQKIRFGDSLDVLIEIPDTEMHGFIPPFALQILIENAIKHNVISQNYPLNLSIYIEGEFIIVRNTLRKKSSGVASTSTGHKSVKERYRILSITQPVFIETETEYIVKLPLLRDQAILNTEENIA